MNFNRQGRRSRRSISEINVTPMVDVMLVLLVIFMITSPMLVGGVDVDLPKAATKSVQGQFDPLVISINEKDEVFVGENRVAITELVSQIDSQTNSDKEKRVFVKGDEKVHHGKIIEVMAKISQAGYSKVSLITEIKN